MLLCTPTRSVRELSNAHIGSSGGECPWQTPTFTVHD